MDIEIIEFKLFNLTLQEPMALITNWLMMLFSVFAYIKIKDHSDSSIKNWRLFFLFFAIATFFGGLGHVFFQYAGIPGKFPNWITSIIAGYFAGLAMLKAFNNEDFEKKWTYFLIIKGIAFLTLSIVIQKFTFIAIDAIITYILFCGIFAYQLFKKEMPEFKYMVFGVLTCIPSIFIFFFKLNPHRWLNKDDLSHLLMLSCIYFFYLGIISRKNRLNNNIN